MSLLLTLVHLVVDFVVEHVHFLDPSHIKFILRSICNDPGAQHSHVAQSIGIASVVIPRSEKAVFELRGHNVRFRTHPSL